MSDPIRIVICRGAVPYAAHPKSAKESWDGAGARRRMAKRAGCDKPGASAGAWAKFRAGFAWYDSEHADTMGAYKLPHHDVENGSLVTVRGGVVAAGNAVQGGRGGVDIPAADLGRVKAHLARHYREFEMEPPWAAQASRAEERTVDRPMALADVDAEKRLLYLIVSRADDVDSYGMTFPADEVERSAHRSMGLMIGINHVCATEGCLHHYGAHAAGATLGACRAPDCLCTAYKALEVGADMVENFIVGVDTAQWHGRDLAEPFKRGDHVIAIKVHNSLLWMFRDGITGASWEGMVEVVPVEAAEGSAE